MKTRILSELHKQRIAEAHRGKKRLDMVGNKLRLGLTCSDETKIKMSLVRIGFKPSSETCKKISESNFGKPRVSIRGNNHWNWKDGATESSKRIRNSLEYRDWRLAVLERDNFTCVLCGQRGGELNVDHIKPFSRFPELRLDVDNGRTLCVPCHKDTDTFGNKSACRNLIS